jgi:flagellar L-ring protein precursor FlgH
MMTALRARSTVCWSAAFVLCATLCRAQTVDPDAGYDALFAAYLNAARRLASASPAPDSQWMANLYADAKARAVNDLVTIQVVESVSGDGRANAAVGKQSSISADLDAFGYRPGTLSGSFGTSFDGGGRTTRASELSAVLTARVVEVLPNGDLVLEGVREIDINGERQIIVLTGVVRPSDIGPQNVVLSTAIGQMRIRYFGRGIIRDNLQPGWLVRVLSRLF